MVNYRQPVNSLGQAANIGQGNLLERVSILETRKRILVADASEEFRRVFTGALEEESGLELAAETGDGQETVRLAKELSPDIVVMDFVLARMDGLEVLSELAALPGRPRVLVLSRFWLSPERCPGSSPPLWGCPASWRMRSITAESLHGFII